VLGYFQDAVSRTCAHKYVSKKTYRRCGIERPVVTFASLTNNDLDGGYNARPPFFLFSVACLPQCYGIYLATAGAGSVKKVPPLCLVYCSYWPVLTHQRAVPQHPVPTLTSMLSAEAIRTKSTRSSFVAEQASSRVQSNSVDRCRPPYAGCRDRSTDMTRKLELISLTCLGMTPRQSNFFFDICMRANTIQSYLPLRRRPRRSLLTHRLDMR
jgi:hypothetical protein